MSIGQLATISGVSKATISRWETNKCNPRPQELAAVLRALDATRAPGLQDETVFPVLPDFLSHLSSCPPLSFRGDLLRAIRIRRGFTQCATSRAINVSQSMIAKWERGEDWPTQDKVHAFCFALDATEQELLTLMATNLALSAPANPYSELESIESEYTIVWSSTGVSDLRYHVLESRSSSLSTKSHAYHDLFVRILCYRARFLAENLRFEESKLYLKRIAKLRSEVINPPRIWQNAAMAELLLVTGTNQSGTAVRDVFERNISHLAHNFQAWMESELALCLAKLGDTDSALRLAHRAVQTASSWPTEVPYRQLTRAKVLATANRTDEAVDLISEAKEQLPDSPGVSINMLLTRIEVTQRSTKYADQRMEAFSAIDEQLNRIEPDNPKKQTFQAKIDSLRISC